MGWLFTDIHQRLKNELGYAVEDGERTFEFYATSCSDESGNFGDGICSLKENSDL